MHLTSRTGLSLALSMLIAVPALADERGSAEPEREEAAPRAAADDATGRDGQEDARPAGVTLASGERRERTRGITLVSGSAPEVRPRRAGAVLFSFDDADLTTEVLPLVEEQVGVRIGYEGAPRAVTLRLVQPVAWRDAVELICQFTRTHLARDHRGQFVLRSRYGGVVEDGVLFDDLGGQLAMPEHIATLKASARREASALQASARSSQSGTTPLIRIGNPRPLQLGMRGRMPNQQARQTGPRKVGPARTGPRQTTPRQTGPRQTGARNPWPGF